MVGTLCVPSRDGALNTVLSLHHGSKNESADFKSPGRTFFRRRKADCADLTGQEEAPTLSQPLPGVAQPANGFLQEAFSAEQSLFTGLWAQEKNLCLTPPSGSWLIGLRGARAPLVVKTAPLVLPR